MTDPRARRLEKLRLRVPLGATFTEDQMSVLDQHPNCQRKLRQLQDPLLPGHSLPLKVGFWEDTPDHVREAGRRAMRRWNDRMKKRTGVEQTFSLWPPEDTSPVDLMIGAKMFSWGEADFGSVASGAWGNHSFGAPIGDSEVGECTLYWDVNRKILAGKIFCPSDAARADCASILAHELGHALLLGHEPHLVGYLMYRNHGGVKGPQPEECRWVKEIWG